MTQPSSLAYTQGTGNVNLDPTYPHLDVIDPNPLSRFYPIGKIWINSITAQVFCLISYTFSRLVKTPNWKNITVNFFVGGRGVGQFALGPTTVHNNACRTDSLVFVTYTNFQIAPGIISIPPETITNGSFILNSTGGGNDASFFNYIIINKGFS